MSERISFYKGGHLVQSQFIGLLDDIQLHPVTVQDVGDSAVRLYEGVDVSEFGIVSVNQQPESFV
jgi:hypothetical protein